jgi:GT2 family glycosyltransferase
MIEIIIASRLSKNDFWDKSATALSLRRLEYDDRWIPRVVFENKQGLPDVYNAHITAGASDSILVFIHDDVWIDDLFFTDRIIEGLQTYDVIGVAGNRRRIPYQPGWPFADINFSWDDHANLSGVLGHGEKSLSPINYLGPVPADCEFLDGIFLAAKKEVLRANGLFFDPQFDFHFYDMDFCRNARQRGMRLGTWPICLTHQSEGSFGSEQWFQKYFSYITKWQD